MFSRPALIMARPPRATVHVATPLRSRCSVALVAATAMAIAIAAVAVTSDLAFAQKPSPKLPPLKKSPPRHRSPPPRKSPSPHKNPPKPRQSPLAKLPPKPPPRFRAPPRALLPTTIVPPVPVPDEQFSLLFPRSYAIQPSDTCESIARQFGTDVRTLEVLNPGLLNCSSNNTLPVFVTIIISFLLCDTICKPKQADTCRTIAEQYGLKVRELEEYNGGLNCSMPDPFGLNSNSSSSSSGGDGSRVGITFQQLCLGPTMPSHTPSPHQCSTKVRVQPGETCNSLVVRWKITLSELLDYNPGLNCSSASLAGMEVCVEMNFIGVPCVKYHYVKAGETCRSLSSTYFKPKKALIPNLNRGWVCTPDKLFVGLVLCIPWW